jgi:hypothetical protein
MSSDTIVLMKIGGVPVYWNEEESKVYYTGELTIDADGGYRSYGPDGCSPAPLDYLANAGYPYDDDDPYGAGNWWGIATNSESVPYFQAEGDKKKHPYPGLFISTTAYLWKKYSADDCRRYVDSETVAFTVIPGNVRMAVSPKFLGCSCRVTDKKTGKVADGVPCCDVGPSNHLGEGSMALAEFFGIDPNPKHGGSCDRSRFLWEFWPGIESESHPLQ